MAAEHGTRTRYNGGCRCDDCVAANSSYHADYRQGRTTGAPLAVVPAAFGPGPVEAAVRDEISGLGVEALPGLVQVALALARLMDNPKAISQQPAAARALTGLLDKLRSASVHGRRGHLAVVRDMTKKGGA